MLKNYLKLALRHLQKQKAFAAINVFGLGVGIACFVLLFLFAANEFQFDHFHRHAADIYRPYVIWKNPVTGEPNPEVYTEYDNPARESLGSGLKKSFPDVVDYARLQLPWGESLLRAGDKNIRTELSFADASLFSIFDLPLAAGIKTGVLREPTDLVIVESRAVKLFGSAEKALGEHIEIELGAKFYPFRVSGVAYDPPGNSSIRFDIIGSYRFMDAHRPDDFEIGNNWHRVVSQTYVQLRPGSRLAGDSMAIARFQRHFSTDTGWTLKMQPLLDIHTDTNFHGWGFTDYQRIDPQTLWILLGIAAGILFIACINFTTLAVARSASRSKEVGVRKVVGAEKGQIAVQFLTEAILLAVISAVLGLFLAHGLLPWFNRLAGRQLRFSFMQYPQLFLALTGIVLLAGMLAGSYPALVLARFRPVEVLKNKLRIGGSNLFTRSLVSFQFALSIFLIGCTIVILKQTNHMLSSNPGFEKENVIVVDASQTDPDKSFPLFRQYLRDRPEIVDITSAAAGMGAGKELLAYSDLNIKANINIIDTNYIRVMGMRLVAGSNLTSASLFDSLRPVVINETFMRVMGWNVNNVVGQKINNFQGRIAVVKGVVRNFNYEAVGRPVFNQIFISTPDKGYSNFYIRVRPGDLAKTIALLRNAWHVVAPAVPLKYSFLDEDIDAFYQSEQNWTHIIASAGVISIALAALGLLGLVSLAAVNRKKEVGIRKVLGAGVGELAVLLSRDFLRLVVIAFFIATPVTWLVMNKWLLGYAVRIELNFSMLLLAGLVVILAAVLAISFEAIKAANANVARSLQTE